jgi:hypothetical protein
MNLAETIWIISQVKGANYMPQIQKKFYHPPLLIPYSAFVLLEEIIKV